MSTIPTSRLYYADSYLASFDATVVERVDTETGPAVVLDTTAFYPTSGGQPHDTGTLGDRRVVNVVVREADQAVLHLLDGPLAADQVRGAVDWARRFDHMQQHTGQHILSQAFIRKAQAATVGFHLGDSYVSIDLDRADLSERAVEEALALANDVVTSNVQVRAWFPDPEELATLSLRKTPEVDGALRTVAIGDFDLSACGGTHVARSGEVGPIHRLRSERFKQGTRISFLCGARARADHAARQRIVSTVSAALTCGVDEIPAAVERLQTELLDTRRELTRLRERELDREAEALVAEATNQSTRFIRRAWTGRPADEIRGLALRTTGNAGVIALLATTGERTQFVFARAEDLATDLQPALKAAFAVIGGGKGGGSRVVQGGGPAADDATVEQALEAAERSLGPGS